MSCFKKISLLLLVAAFCCFILSDFAMAQGVVAGNSSSAASGSGGVFSELVNAGKDIFYGMRDLIYLVAGFGIIGVGLTGFFGNLNWKWLGAILISLFIIAGAGGFLELIAGEGSGSEISDTIK